MTTTTGGTCSDVEGRSSAEGVCTIELWAEDKVGTAGTAAAAELEARPDVAGVLELEAEENTGLAEGSAPDAEAVGNTVVYSVFMTTRRDDVVIVEFTAGGAIEGEDSSGDAVDLIGVTDDDCKTEAELIRVLLGVAGP